MNEEGGLLTGICLILACWAAFRLISRSNRYFLQHPLTPEDAVKPVLIGGKVSPLFTVVRMKYRQSPFELHRVSHFLFQPRPSPVITLRGYSLALSSWFKAIVWATETGRLKLIVTLACITGTVGIGLAFFSQDFVVGWQLESWAACVFILAAVLIGPFKLRLNRTWGIGFALFAVALVLRLPLLDQIPGGLHVDEMSVADFALLHVFPRAGITINPFSVGPVSQPTLFHYIIRLTLYLFGNNIDALRSSSAIVGSLAVVVTYAVIAVLHNRSTAFFGAILMAAYHFHIQWSRLALNNIWDTLWVPLMLAAYAWGWKKGSGAGAVVAGLALGLSQYFYAGSKIGIFLSAFLIIWYWRQETAVKNRVIYLGKFLAVTACVAAPMLIFALFRFSTYTSHMPDVWGWSEGAIRVITGDPLNLPAYLWYQITHSLGAYFLYDDVTGFYGPGIPFLIGLAVPLFLIGIGIAIYKRQWIPVLWILLVTFFGGFLLAGNPSSSHYVPSIPAICWLVALPLGWLFEHKHSRWAFLLLAIILTTDLYFYFAVYVPGGPRDLINAFPTIK
jgi:4-amino-4-deoxy-L-arabinose transferase-like glycosyltransferase